MSKTLREYLEFLHEKDTMWPKPPAIDSPKAKPSIAPLPGIRAVVWNVYGTLVRIADGELLHDHPQRLRMQVALEKTVEEFNMWNSMYRTKEAPWEYMYQRWTNAIDDTRLAGTGRKGDVPCLDSAKLWRKLIAQLEKKEYSYDRSIYGDEDELAEKVAYFFHAKLQGTEAAPRALRALRSVAEAGLMQGIAGDTQVFTVAQLYRLLSARGTVPPPGELFRAELLVQSHNIGTQRTSPGYWEAVLERFASLDLKPAEVLLISSNVPNDLALAKRHGLRTALYAGDRLGLRAKLADLKDPETRPDRLLVDLAQVREILKIA